MAGVSMPQFVGIAAKYLRDVPGVGPLPELVPDEVAAACVAALRLDVPLGTATAQVSFNQAATLIGWLAYRRSGPDRFANQSLAIISRSRQESLDLLQRGRKYAVDAAEAAYRGSPGGGGGDYLRVHRAVFNPDTRDLFGVSDAGSCSVYTRNSQFRSTILFRQVGATTAGVSANLCRLTVPYR